MYFFYYPPDMNLKDRMRIIIVRNANELIFKSDATIKKQEKTSAQK